MKKKYQALLGILGCALMVVILVVSIVFPVQYTQEDIDNYEPLNPKLTWKFILAVYPITFELNVLMAFFLFYSFGGKYET